MADLKQAQKSDLETAGMQTAEELKRKKRMQILIYGAAFAVFQTIIILVFALTVMRIKSPKFRVRSITIQELTYSSSATPPSFNIKLNAEVGVKNTNFGHFKFENSTVLFDYGGSQVGEAFVAKARARARSTKKMNLTVDLSSNNVAISDLGSDLSSGFLTLTSHSKLSGKVHLMKVMKKKKSAQMSCTITINLAEKSIHDLKCK